MSGEPTIRDGKELFYLAPDDQIMAVSVKMGNSFQANIPTPLFKIDSVKGIQSTVRGEYDVTADGQRFLVSSGIAGARGLPFTVVVNWTAGLKP